MPDHDLSLILDALRAIATTISAACALYQVTRAHRRRWRRR